MFGASALALASTLLMNARVASANPADPPTAQCTATTNMVDGWGQLFAGVPQLAYVTALFAGPSCVTGPFGCGAYATRCEYDMNVFGSTLVGRAAPLATLEQFDKHSNQWYPAFGPLGGYVQASCSNGNQTSINQSYCPGQQNLWYGAGWNANDYTFRIRCSWQALPITEFALRPTAVCTGNAVVPPGGG